MSTSRPDRAIPLRVLTVCTGNLCRSPTAEQLLRARLDPSSNSVVVSSAGTMAHDGDPMEPESAAWSQRLGGDPGWHRSRYLTPKLLGPVDLILGLAREHRRAVVDLRPAVIKKTFTLLEFARLAAEVSDEDLSALANGFDDHAPASDRLHLTLPLLARARSRKPPVADGPGDDVVDPIGRDPGVHERSAQQIGAAVDEVVRVLKITFPGGG